MFSCPPYLTKSSLVAYKYSGVVFCASKQNILCSISFLHCKKSNHKTITVCYNIKIEDVNLSFIPSHERKRATF